MASARALDGLARDSGIEPEPKPVDDPTRSSAKPRALKRKKAHCPPGVGYPGTKEHNMTLCPVALAVGCKKCPAFSFCPLKTVIGDQLKETDKPAPPKPQSKGRRKGA